MIILSLVVFFFIFLSILYLPYANPLTNLSILYPISPFRVITRISSTTNLLLSLELCLLIDIVISSKIEMLSCNEMKDYFLITAVYGISLSCTRTDLPRMSTDLNNFCLYGLLYLKWDTAWTQPIPTHSLACRSKYQKLYPNPKRPLILSHFPKTLVNRTQAKYCIVRVHSKSGEKQLKSTFLICYQYARKGELQT